MSNSLDFGKYYGRLDLGVVILDAKLSILYMNPWLKNRLQQDLSEAKNLADIFGDHDYSFIKKLIQDTIKTNSLRILSQVFHSWILPLPDSRFSDGMMKQSCSLIPFKDQETGAINALLQIRDDSDRVLQVKQLNQEKLAARQINEKLEALAKNLNRAQSISKTGSWSWDLSNDVIMLSEEMYRLFGYKSEANRPELFSYQTFLSRIGTEDKIKVDDIFKNGLRSQQPFDFEFRTIPFDGKYRLIQTFCDIDYDEHDNPLRIHGTNRDITAERAAQKQLRQYQEHLEEMVQERTVELEIAKDKAETANRTKTEFLNNMSHEFRTPLHQINSFSSIGAKKSGSEQEYLKSVFEKIKVSCKRMIALVDDLLSLSDLEMGRLKYEKRPYHLSYLLNNLKVDFTQRLNEKNLSLSVEEIDLVIYANAEMLQTVFSKITDNAVRYADPGSTIAISFARDTDNLTVTFKNDGIPIPREELKTVFESFQQSSLTNTGAGGTGLGLAICKQMIAGQNGKVWAEPYDRGAIIKITLPLEPTPSGQSATVSG